MDIAAADGLPEGDWREWLRWVLQKRRRMRVTGDSMKPTLMAGDEVFVDPSAYQRDKPEPDEIVVACHPFQTGLKLIKRIQSVSTDGDCFLISDNRAEGTDSRAFGAVPGSALLGRVTSRRRV